MTASETARQQLVDCICSLEGKNTYTQSDKRKNADKGFSDCSSLVAWVYMHILKIDIGSDTPEQILSLKGVDIDICEKDCCAPKEKWLRPGDLLFFAGDDNSRPFRVGHVEMYIGDGRLIGHTDDTQKGPAIKNMESFCNLRQSQNKGYIKTRRFVF